MGHEQDNPLSTTMCTMLGKVEVRTMDAIRIEQLANIKRAQMAIDSMRKNVSMRPTKKRTQAVKRHYRKTSVRAFNFSDGAYVLSGNLQRERNRKPSLKWTGPYRVVECCSGYIFLIESLLDGEKDERHGLPFMSFRNSNFEITEELREHLTYEEGELLMVDLFSDIRRKQGIVKVIFKWRGFSLERMDWVTLESLQDDVPIVVQEYIADVLKNRTKRQRSIAASV